MSQNLGELVRGMNVALLTTACPDGSLRSRPMVALEPEPDGTLWFFTREHSSKVEEVEGHEEVNVSYADHPGQRYVSVSGKARPVRDRERMRRLWGPALLAWFPRGLDDPDLALLRVDVDRAEHWDARSGAMVPVAPGRDLQGARG
jgi:general stress protein 26